MPRLSLFLMCLCAIFSITIASPLPSNGTAVQLEERSGYSGTATYFGVGLGACGFHDNDSSHIVALGSNHYKGKCNEWIHVTNTDNGKTVTAKVRDLCPSCSGSNRIDLSPSAFSAIGAKSKGVLTVKWYFT